MEIAITGGTGFVGSHLSNHFAENTEAEVTAISRSPSDSPISIDDSVELREGDVTDPSSLDFEGFDVVINLVALSPLFKPKKGLSHEKVHLGGTKNVVDVAESDGVDHVIQMSGLGADPDANTPYLRTKGEAENVVKDSSLDWTIFRPSIIFGEGDEFVRFTKLVTTPFITGLPGGGRTRYQPIWVKDLAPMFAEVATTPGEHAGETYEVGGPEVLSLARMTKLVYKSEGRSVRIMPVPMFLAKVGMTFFEYVPFIPIGIDQYRSLKFNNTVKGNNDVEVFGYDETDLRRFPEYLGIE